MRGKKLSSGPRSSSVSGFVRSRGAHVAGPQGMTNINAWDTAGARFEELDYPVSFAAQTGVSSVGNSVVYVIPAECLLRRSVSLPPTLRCALNAFEQTNRARPLSRDRRALRVGVFPLFQRAAEEGTAVGVTPTCVFWSELRNDWVVDGLVLDSAILDIDRTSTITCSTFHLSSFAIAEEEALSGDWAAVYRPPGLGVLKQVWRTALENQYHTCNEHAAGDIGTSVCKKLRNVLDDKE